MRRIIVCSLLLLMMFTTYTLVYAEDVAEEKKADNQLIKNPSFESTVDNPPIEKSFPFGWHKFTADGGEVSMAYGGGKAPNGIKVNSTNPQPLYTNCAYINLQDATDLLNLAGKKIKFSAKVKVDAAGDAAGAVSAALKQIEQGKDFTGEDEIKNFSNFAGVNIIFSFNPSLMEKAPENAVTGVVPAAAKIRTIAVAKSDDVIELFCEATIPATVNEAVVLLECKGVATATFSELKLNFPQNSKLQEPYNLALNDIIPNNDDHPRGWFYKPGAESAYITQSSLNKRSGEHSLEIGNPDPLNNAENCAFNLNFDVASNKALWGAKVKVTAYVKTNMSAGKTHGGMMKSGKLTLTQVENPEEIDLAKGFYGDFRDLLGFNNYASIGVVCRKSDGKALATHADKTCVRDFAFGVNDWTEISAEFTVPPRTQSIEWTLCTRGIGRAWFDDVKIETPNAEFALENLGFEDIYGKAPKNWLCSATSGAIVVTDEREKTDGERSVVLINPNLGQNATVFAGYNVSLSETRGCKIVFTADVKPEIIKNEFTQSALLQLHPSANERVDITCMEAWPKSLALKGTSKEWVKDWKAALIVHDDVEGLMANVVLQGKGKVYFDNVKLTKERLSFPATALGNANLRASNLAGLAGWTVEGVTDLDLAPSYIYAKSPLWGELNKDSGMLSQEIAKLTPELLAQLYGKPITIKGLVKCEGNTKAALGFEFYGENEKEPIQTKFADGEAGSMVVSGVPTEEFLFAPYSLTKVSTVIPEGTQKVVVVLKFTGGEKGARFHSSGLRLMGADNAPSDEELTKMLEGKFAENEAFKDIAPKSKMLKTRLEMGYNVRPQDSITSSDPFFVDALGLYGYTPVVRVGVSSEALSNPSFSVADGNSPMDYKQEGVKARLFFSDNVSEGLYNYHVLRGTGGKVSMSQTVTFPEDIRSIVVGETLEFTAKCGSRNMTDSVVTIEFLDENNNVISTATAPITELTDKVIGKNNLKTKETTASSPVPQKAVAARFSISGTGTGVIAVAGTEMSYMLLAGGMLDKLAYLMVFDFSKVNVLIGMFIFGFLIIFFIYTAKRKDLFIRKIAGLDSVDEAVGRATEMGKPILYCPGLDALEAISTIAAINILGRVAEKIAEYDTPLLVPNRDPIVMTVCQETVKSAFLNAGRPDAFTEDSVYYVSDQQFAYVSAVAGTMMRDKPAANFYMGGFYAESLILAETGAMTGSIQVAGTDSVHQLPFFIVACDYTLIGEELYAASAYLSREPMQMGSLKGSDYSKMGLFIIVLVGCIAASINSPALRWLVELLNVQ